MQNSYLVIIISYLMGWPTTGLYGQCDRENMYDYPIGISSSGGLNQIVIGDFDSDGDDDVALTSEGESAIAVRFGNGSGMFGPSIYYSAGAVPHGLAAGDIDNDDDMDLVATNLHDGDISVYFNNGARQFSDQVRYDVGIGPTGLCMADFDNDGSIDIAVANATSESVSVLLNDGDGGFENITTVPAPNDVWSLVAGDFDGDGNSDLACVIFSFTGDDLYLYSGNGDGTFSPNGSYDGGDRPRTIAAGDLNSDGHLDLTVGDGYDRSVHFFINDGTGILSPHSVPMSYSNADTHIDDIDDDGVSDIVVSLTIGNEVAVLFGNGDLTFDVYTYVAPSGFSMPRWIYTADMNSDGYTDIIRTTDSSARILINACGSSCNSPADLNKDGTVDFFDISQLIIRYNSNDSTVDFTGDGRINFFDISAFIVLYIQGCS